MDDHIRDLERAYSLLTNGDPADYQEGIDLLDGIICDMRRHQREIDVGEAALL